MGRKERLSARMLQLCLQRPRSILLAAATLHLGHLLCWFLPPCSIHIVCDFSLVPWYMLNWFQVPAVVPCIPSNFLCFCQWVWVFIRWHILCFAESVNKYICGRLFALTIGNLTLSSFAIAIYIAVVCFCFVQRWWDEHHQYVRPPKKREIDMTASSPIRRARRHVSALSGRDKFTWRARRDDV